MANTSGAEALRELRDRLEEALAKQEIANGQPVTWGRLFIMVSEATRAVEDLDYGRYMGDDM